jgi:hypothetical protein
MMDLTDDIEWQSKTLKKRVIFRLLKMWQSLRRRSGYIYRDWFSPTLYPKAWELPWSR